MGETPIGTPGTGVLPESELQATAIQFLTSSLLVHRAVDGAWSAFLAKFGMKIGPLV